MNAPATLLVVDDNPVNLQLLFKFLSTSGYRVLVAEDGESAIGQAVETRPDLILMDVLLPGMSGFETTRALQEREATAGIPVIFLTALSRTSDKIEGFRAGGVDYLTKPLQFEEVLARIRVHLEIRRLQDELESTNRELTERDRRRDRLLSIIAHDLKSPMATFVNATRDLSRRSPHDPAFGEMLAALSERAERMNGFLETLLEWSRIQLDSSIETRTRFELDELIGRVLDHVADAASAKEIHLRSDVQKRVEIEQNRTALQMVLINLATNAIKFTPRDGSVGIRAREEEGVVTLEVHDTGVGIEPERLEKLFEGHKQVRRTGTAGEQGAGLGLMLSRDLVAWMRGTLTVDSTPERGSVFTIRLPEGYNSDQ